MTLVSLDSTPTSTLVIRAMQNSLSIQSHFQLLLWMQSDIQEIIPHDLMITFSGAIQGQTYHYDIVSALPGIRTHKIPHCSIHSFRTGIHQRWANSGGQVASASTPGGVFANPETPELNKVLGDMKHIVFHAIPDTRFNADHLYILLRRETSYSMHERKMFELLLPHIDAAVRKIDGLPILEPELVAEPTLLKSLINAGLSTREIEILEWVRNGKTNIEIGMILDISAYTVKNHLQRIFKKINVSNRAQAVGKLEEMTNEYLSAIAA